MSTFTDWLDAVLLTGESVQDAPPDPHPERRAVVARLRAAFDRHALAVAGPVLPFDPDTAFAAASLLAVACWRQASGESTLPLPCPEPAGPAAHLSADVTLRLLPGVYCRAVSADGPLAGEIETALRRWPLAGVRADLAGGPTTDTAFTGHRGLRLLYAERLAVTPRAGWVPPPGPARDIAERVFAGRRLTLPEPRSTASWCGVGWSRCPGRNCRPRCWPAGASSAASQSRA